MKRKKDVSVYGSDVLIDVLLNFCMLSKNG